MDIDGSGSIDYSEWVVATINKENLLTDDKLWQAFCIIDKDGGGSISADEIKALFSSKDQKIDDQVWDKIIQEVDEDASGEIDFAEFCLMMKKLMEDED